MESAAFEERFKKWALEQWPDPAERARQGWILPAMAVHKHWGAGKEVSADDFEMAVLEVTELTLGGGPPPLVAT